MANILERDVEKLQQLLTLNDVARITTYSKASIYRLISSSEFPAPLKIGKHRSAWRPSDIQTWMDSKPQRLAPR